jgi:hypothetical protein
MDALIELWSPLLEPILQGRDLVKEHDSLLWRLGLHRGLPTPLLEKGLAAARKVAAAFGDGSNTYDLTLALFMARLGRSDEGLPLLDRLEAEHRDELALVLAVRALLASATGREDPAAAALRALPSPDPQALSLLEESFHRIPPKR